MGPRLRTTFLGLLAAAAAVLVINLSTAATHRATVLWPCRLDGAAYLHASPVCAIQWVRVGVFG